jgi:hypothetical protein
MIGVQAGPLTILHQGFIPRNHQAACMNRYFYPDMAGCGINYDWSIYANPLCNQNGDSFVSRHWEILDSLGIWAYASPWTGGPINADMAWESEKSGEQQIWDGDFFPDFEHPGNAVTLHEGWQFWSAHELEKAGGFIIGADHNDPPDTTLDSNWVQPHNPWKAFCAIDDRYFIYLRMRKIEHQGDPDDVLCTLYALDRDSDIVACPITAAECSAGTFGWTKIFVDAILSHNNWGSNIRFALRWNGPTRVDVSHIKYESFTHAKLQEAE